MPASAAAWLAEASPKLQHTIASAGSPLSTPRRRARATLVASPLAFGRCEAIVEVCGGTHIAREPQTLWRPPVIGSSLDAHRESSVSQTGVEPARWRERACMKAPER